MKSRIAIFLIIATVLLGLCGCTTTQVEISYLASTETTSADSYFEENMADELIELCTSMSSRNDDPEARDNFFRYMLIKTDSIIKNNAEDKYEFTLNIISTCLNLPIAEQAVVSGLSNNYRIIDQRLTEKTKEYILGKWTRAGKTSMAGTVIEVMQDDKGVYCARVSAIPEDTTTPYAVNDTKWKNIQFANNSKFFFSDLTAKENDDSYKVGAGTVSIYSGATAIIDFENNTITVEHEKSDISNGLSQVWVKEGFESEDDVNAEESDDEESEQDSEPAVQVR